MQAGLNTVLRPSTELHVAVGHHGLLLGLLHYTPGDQLHPDLSGIEQVYTRQLANRDALSYVEHSGRSVAWRTVDKVVGLEGHSLVQQLGG